MHLHCFPYLCTRNRIRAPQRGLDFVINRSLSCAADTVSPDCSFLSIDPCFRRTKNRNWNPQVLGLKIQKKQKHKKDLRPKDRKTPSHVSVGRSACDLLARILNGVPSNPNNTEQLINLESLKITTPAPGTRICPEPPRHATSLSSLVSGSSQLSIP